jgi:hypothetical protein
MTQTNIESTDATIQYIGDGVYVKWDGPNAWLLTGSPWDPVDKVCLEPEVWVALKKLMETRHG